jgi:hypothetical protein
MKPAYDGTAGGRIFFSFAGRFLLMQVLEIRTLGTPDPMDCKIFRQRQVFIKPKFCFKTGFIVY